MGSSEEPQNLIISSEVQETEYPFADLISVITTAVWLKPGVHNLLLASTTVLFYTE
jgi:hypothetical protein